MRLYAWRQQFKKGYAGNWTKEIFLISKVNMTKPITFNITDQKGEDIEGTIYEQELLKSKFKKSQTNLCCSSSNCLSKLLALLLLSDELSGQVFVQLNTL